MFSRLKKAYAMLVTSLKHRGLTLHALFGLTIHLPYCLFQGMKSMSSTMWIAFFASEEVESLLKWGCQELLTYIIAERKEVPDAASTSSRRRHLGFLEESKILFLANLILPVSRLFLFLKHDSLWVSCLYDIYLISL